MKRHLYGCLVLTALALNGCGAKIEETTEPVVDTTTRLGETTEIAKARIRERSLSKTSNMPEGMVNVLKLDEVLDLLAYLISDVEPSQANAAK